LVSTDWIVTTLLHHKPISGSLTLINEANFWPKVKIKYPTELKGQLYIPSINWLLMCRYCTSLRRIKQINMPTVWPLYYAW
jgi:K+ transporter